jgi:hypothetical protein
MTIERPMFPPADPTRRRFLSVAVAGAAAIASAAPATAGLAEPDPIFAAIKRHRAAGIVWNAAVAPTATWAARTTALSAASPHPTKIRPMMNLVFASPHRVQSAVRLAWYCETAVPLNPASCSPCIHTTALTLGT